MLMILGVDQAVML